MKQRLLFLLSAVILSLSVTARDHIHISDGKGPDNAVRADLPEIVATENADEAQPCSVDMKALTGETAQMYLPLSETTEQYGQWEDWQTTDVTTIREFYTKYGFNDTQTAVDKGIVKVQRRLSLSNPSLSQLKLLDVFGDVDLIANVNTAETEKSQVVFPDQDTGIANNRGGSYDTFHFFAQSYSNYSCYEDGAIILEVWALIRPNYGYPNTIYPPDTLIFPGKWSEPTGLGRYIPEPETYGNLKSLISSLGNEGVAWEEAVDVDYCVNLDFPNRELYTFHKLLGGNDVCVDRLEKADDILYKFYKNNTGFTLGGELYDGSEELKFYASRLFNYDATYSFDLQIQFLAEQDDDYRASRRICLTKDGHEMLSAKIEGRQFISSTQKSATFKVPHSGEVDEWRLYVMNYKMGYNFAAFDKAIRDGEEANFCYAVASGDNITIPCDTLDASNSLLLVPMNRIDGKMKKSGSIVSLNVYRNVPLAGEWEEWGVGKMTDVVAFPYFRRELGEDVLQLPPAERQVRIERRKDAPGIIRIPDPYKGDYPYKDKMKMIDPDDTFYLVIDTTDPSRVTAENTMTGADDYSFFNFDDYNPQNTEYGKCLDKKVTFLTKLTWDSWIANPNYGVVPQLSLELPGYKDFTVAINNLSDDQEKVQIENKSENVVSVDVALVPADEYDSYYPELMCELVMNRSEELIIHNYPVETGKTLSVAIAELAQSVSRSAGSLPTGRYHVVVVPRDADGTPHYGPVSEEVKYVAPWKYIGIAEINDQALWMTDYVSGGIDMKAEAYEDPFNPGFYMLKDCYKDYAPNFIERTGVEENVFCEYLESSLFIDARNSDKVNLVADAFFGNLPYFGFNTGIGDDNYGYNYINTVGNLNNSSDEKYYGKKQDDYILFDRNSLAYSTYDSDKSFYYITKSLTIKLPHVENGAVDVVENETDASAPEQWYNLQGVRVNIDNVPSGIYIRRQGNVTSKVAVRR